MAWRDWVVDGVTDVVEEAAEGVLTNATWGMRTGQRVIGGVAWGSGEMAARRVDGMGLTPTADDVRGYAEGAAGGLGFDAREAELDESDDPTRLVHGDVSAMERAAGHLASFAASLDLAAAGLSRMDAGSFKGRAATAYDVEKARQPRDWARAADACRAACAAWRGDAATVAWAQAQAGLAVHLNQRGRVAHAAAAGNAAGVGEDDLGRARHLLTHARAQRDEAGARAAGEIRQATADAPARPRLSEQLTAGLGSLWSVSTVEAAHFDLGMLQGVTGVVELARGLDPRDRYNRQHPAAYDDGLRDHVDALLHPGEAVEGLIDQFHNDPSAGLGELVPGLLLGGLGGAGAGAGRLSRIRRGKIPAVDDTTVAVPGREVGGGQREPAKSDAGLSGRGLVPAPGTRVVPAGIPRHWRVAGARKGGGVVFYDPRNKGDAVRVMQGSPLSPHPNSQQPYVRWQRHGHPLDRLGNVLPSAKVPGAHIPLADFKFLPEVFQP